MSIPIKTVVRCHIVGGSALAICILSGLFHPCEGSANLLLSHNTESNFKTSLFFIFFQCYRMIPRFIVIIALICFGPDILGNETLGCKIQVNITYLFFIT